MKMIKCSCLKARDEWEKQAPEGRVAQALEAQLVKLIILEKKTPNDFKEIDLLMRQLERMAKINKYNNGGNEADLNPNLKNRTAGPRKQTAKNVLTEEQIEKLLEDFDDGLFEYQKVWYRAREQRNRALLKSRQIGATFYFAREALIKAVTTGRNQIFLSASKAQAHGFKTYIKDFVLQSIGVDLQGIQLPSLCLQMKQFNSFSLVQTLRRLKVIMAICILMSSSGTWFCHT